MDNLTSGILQALAVLVIGGTLLLWSLLSGFGCAMNAAGCSGLRLDLSRDALFMFLPFIALGASMILAGARLRR